MKTLTFAENVEFDLEERFIPIGATYEVADLPIQYEGFTPVIITWAMDCCGNKINVNNVVDYFSNDSFVEYKSMEKAS